MFLTFFIISQAFVKLYQNSNRTIVILLNFLFVKKPICLATNNKTYLRRGKRGNVPRVNQEIVHNEHIFLGLRYGEVSRILVRE